MVWDWIIALYLFLAGLGAGAFIFATVVGLLKTQTDTRKLRLGSMIIALAAVALGTCMLMIDAKAGFANPLRFVYLVSNLHSVMTWGVILLSAFLVLAFVDCIVVVKKNSCRALDIVTAVFALGVATYTGVLLGVSMAYPLWNAAILPVLFVVSALSSGFAAAGVYGHFACKDQLAQVKFRPLWGVIMPIIEGLLVAFLLIVTAHAAGYQAEAGAQSVAAIVSGTYAVVFWLGLVIIGLAVPFCIELAGLLRGRKSARNTVQTETADAGSSGFAIALADAGVVIGAFCLRYIIVLAAVPVVL